MLKDLILDMGEGLILRHSNPEDRERLAAFIVQIHSDGTDLDSRCLDAWTRDLLSGAHPTFKIDDFTVVENTQKGEIISCMNLVSQTWSFDGIPFGVGRPEMVGTLPEYRRRGLIRSQFDEIHRWSKERGELIQVITGIPNYYRQFGYEMAINLGGRRTGSTSNVPQLVKDQKEPYAIRKAATTDCPFILDLMTNANRRYPLACLWTPELMIHEISQKSEFNINRRQICMIENEFYEPVGFFAHPIVLKDSRLSATSFELKPGVSWLDVTPSVARYLWTTGGLMAQRDGGECLGFGFWLGEVHPAYQVLAHCLPEYRRPYAWYIRVPDLPGFLWKIAPALESRLERSVCCGYQGEVKISFYRQGVSVEFEHGKIRSISALEANELDKSNAAFPGLTFLQLLFGYRSLDEIRYAFPDCSVDDDRTGPLLHALFPRQPSNVWPIS